MPLFSSRIIQNALKHGAARGAVQYGTSLTAIRGYAQWVIKTAPAAAKQVVALFNASDDTVDMVQRMLGASGLHCLVGCHFTDLKKGAVDFVRYMARHEPDVLIFDISPPYLENWQFFKTLRDGKAMNGRGLVVTTTNKDRLDEAVGADSEAIEIVGKPYDLDQIKEAIHASLKRARTKDVPSS